MSLQNNHADLFIFIQTTYEQTSYCGLMEIVSLSMPLESQDCVKRKKLCSGVAEAGSGVLAPIETSCVTLCKSFYCSEPQ